MKKGYLITYQWGNGNLAYDVALNVVDWLLEVDSNNDAPYFILNTVEISMEEYNKIDGVLKGM